MSNGVNNRLNYLEETKVILMDAINETGGNLESTEPFSEYSKQIQYIIDTQIIPQSTLDELIVKTENINGEEI